jgi:hypothetical protein
VEVIGYGIVEYMIERGMYGCEEKKIVYMLYRCMANMMYMGRMSR